MNGFVMNYFQYFTKFYLVKKHKLVKEYKDWNMTPVGVYIKISRSMKLSHWVPYVVPDTLLLQEISYQTYVNGVAASLH